jgi:hypothetical protein
MQEVEFQTPSGCVTIEIRLGAKNNTDIVWFDYAAVVGARCEMYWDILHLAAEGGIT